MKTQRYCSDLSELIVIVIVIGSANRTKADHDHDHDHDATYHSLFAEQLPCAVAHPVMHENISRAMPIATSSS